ncbi:hypothetical protein C8Q78DRAFT_991854 [Trametes maxima]|nr:hypothetical protein C8Q78DRAFT_991854 [Trametes maxima]
MTSIPMLALSALLLGQIIMHYTSLDPELNALSSGNNTCLAHCPDKTLEGLRLVVGGSVASSSTLHVRYNECRTALSHAVLTLSPFRPVTGLGYKYIGTRTLCSSGAVVWGVLRPPLVWSGSADHTLFGEVEGTSKCLSPWMYARDGDVPSRRVVVAVTNSRTLSILVL